MSVTAKVAFVSAGGAADGPSTAAAWPVSWAAGLNYSVELNERNTILSVGWSHSFDRILPADGSYLDKTEHKNTDEFQFGVSQILGPETVVSLSGTIAFSAYLGNTLRYDIDLGGTTFKADVGDPWHHEQLPMGARVDLSCSVASTLAIPAD